MLGFPFIFRGALDVRATTINEEMKIAAAHALAELARQQVPEEVAAAYGEQPIFGPEYIIPAPFDPRLIGGRPHGGRAGGDGFRRRAPSPIIDERGYASELRARLNPHQLPARISL